jgi:hypothetical protein
LPGKGLSHSGPQATLCFESLYANLYKFIRMVSTNLIYIPIIDTWLNRRNSHNSSHKKDQKINPLSPTFYPLARKV